jgi:hypothetical protein
MNKSLTMLAMLGALITMGTAANALTLAAAGYGGNTQNTVVDQVLIDVPLR